MYMTSPTKIRLIKNLVDKLEMVDGNTSLATAMYVTRHAREILRYISTTKAKQPPTSNTSQLNAYERKVKLFANKASKRATKILQLRYEQLIDSIRKMQIKQSYTSNQHKLKKDVSLLSNDIQVYLKLQPSTNYRQRELLNEVRFLQNYFFNADSANHSPHTR